MDENGPPCSVLDGLARIIHRRVAVIAEKRSHRMNLLGPEPQGHVAHLTFITFCCFLGVRAVNSELSGRLTDELETI